MRAECDGEGGMWCLFVLVLFPWKLIVIETIRSLFNVSFLEAVEV